MAQPRSPDEPLETIYPLRAENLVTLREALRSSIEVSRGKHLFQAWSVPSLRFPEARNGYPLLLYQYQGRELITLGPQLSRGELPLGLPLEFEGLRWTHKGGDWDLTLTGGELLEPGLLANPLRSRFVSANAGGYIDNDHLMRLKFLHQQSDFAPDSTVVEWEFQPDLGPGTLFWSRLGADFGETSFGPDRLSAEGSLQFGGRNLRYSLYHREHGRNYARFLYNPFAGSGFSESSLEWALNKELTFFQDTVLLRDYRFGNSSSLRFRELVQWRPGNDFLLSGEFSTGRNGTTNFTSDFQNLGASFYWSPSVSTNLNGFYSQSSNDTLRGLARQQSFGLRARHQVTPSLEVTADFQNDRNSLGLQDGSRTAVGLGLTYHLSEDRGHISASANQVSQNVMGSGLSNDFLAWSVGGRLTPHPRVRMGGFLSTVRGPDLRPKLQADAHLDYLVNENLELGLSYKRDPFLSQVFPFQGQEHFLGLELRQSFGGATEASFKRRLAPVVNVQVSGTVGDRREFFPLADWPVYLDGEFVGRTDSAGDFKVATEPGLHLISAIDEKVPVQYEPLSESNVEVSLEATERKKLEFSFQVHSGVRIVSFNDFESEGQPGLGYTPLPGVQVLLDGDRILTTDESGVLGLEKLSPGSHHLEVVPESVPEGFEATLPMERRLILEPGSVENVAFGFQGRGRLTGAIHLEGLEGEGRVPRFWLRLNGEPLVRLEPNTPFEVEIPAGLIELELSLGSLSDDYVALEPLVIPVQVRPRETVSHTFQLTLPAQVDVRVLDDKGVPLSGVAVEARGSFIYTDSEGRASVKGLTPGEVRLRLSSQTLPEGVDPGLTEFVRKLAPGEVASWTVRLEKKK